MKSTLFLEIHHTDSKEPLQVKKLVDCIPLLNKIGELKTTTIHTAYEQYGIRVDLLEINVDLELVGNYVLFFFAGDMLKNKHRQTYMELTVESIEARVGTMDSVVEGPFELKDIGYYYQLSGCDLGKYAGVYYSGKSKVLH